MVSLRISRALVDKGCRVRFASPTDGSFTRLCKDIADVDLVPLERLSHLGRTGRIARYLRSIGADLVHTHTPIAASVLWRVGSRLAGVPMIDHVHVGNFFGPPGIKSRIARGLEIATRGVPRKYIAVSQATASELLEHGYPNDRVVQVYNPISWPQTARRERLNRPGIVGCFGRITPPKGQFELIEAFARIANADPTCRLWIVGHAGEQDESYLLALHRRVGELRLDSQVEFLGHRRDVRELMLQLTALVLPSRHEAFPLVVLEAMSLGVPVIAFPVAGVQELIEDGLSGLLVNPGDEEGLVAAIKSVLDDAPLSERISRAGYDHVWNNFGETATLDPMVKLILREVHHARRD